MSNMRHVGSLKNRITGFLRYDLRGNVRILYGTAATLLVLILLVILVNLLQIKKVELVVDGRIEVVKTKAGYVQELLAERGITVDEHDWVSAPLTDRVDDHERIEVTFAIPVTIEADNRTWAIHTTARTVGQLLEQTEVQVGELDIVEPGLDASVREGEYIRIARIEKRIESETEIIPYDIVTREDPTLSKGKEKTVQEGQAGLIEYEFERVYQDGQLVEERLLSSNTEREPANKIVAVGTRSEVAILSASSPNIQTVTKDGVSFGVKKIIEATLTAYDAGPQSTGKTEDHPYYGITYTGTKVKEGRTAAVDPDVIPFGWWIYIEGYGFRRAEDKGSGVQGHWVDIYFDSLEDAEEFGKKKGTVYIIGPHHPAGEEH